MLQVPFSMSEAFADSCTDSVAIGGLESGESPPKLSVTVHHTSPRCDGR